MEQKSGGKKLENFSAVKHSTNWGQRIVVGSTAVELTPHDPEVVGSAYAQIFFYQRCKLILNETDLSGRWQSFRLEGPQFESHLPFRFCLTIRLYVITALDGATYPR